VAGDQGRNRRDRAAGLPLLDGLYAEFIDNGGQIWLCGACTKPRGITEEHLVKGSTIVGAAKVVEEVIGGAKTVAFAWRDRGDRAPPSGHTTSPTSTI